MKHHVNPTSRHCQMTL